MRVKGCVDGTGGGLDGGRLQQWQGFHKGRWIRWRGEGVPGGGLGWGGGRGCFDNKGFRRVHECAAVGRRRGASRRCCTKVEVWLTSHRGYLLILITITTFVRVVGGYEGGRVGAMRGGTLFFSHQSVNIGQTYHLPTDHDLQIDLSGQISILQYMQQ